MTDEPEKKQDAQEITPPPADTPPPKKSVAHKHHKRSGKRAGWFIVVVLIFAGAGFYGYTVYQKQSNLLGALSEQQAVLRNELRAQQNQLEEQIHRQIQAMQSRQDELSAYLDVMRQQNQHLRKDWLILEAEYLMQMANHRLLFERDVSTAIAALDAADMRLRETGDPAVLGVRKVIAEAIQSLKQVPQADRAGLSLTLSAINKELETLPLKTPDPKSRADGAQRDTDATKEISSWKELPAAIWRDLKGLVVIRDHRDPVQPLISPDQRFFLIENLRLQIEQARLAMLSGQGELYKERIATAIVWIETHFNSDSAHTQSVLDTLQQLQSVAVAPPLPDISPVYNALQKLRTGKVPDAAPESTQGNHS